jgi:hypothetical protein
MGQETERRKRRLRGVLGDREDTDPHAGDWRKPGVAPQVPRIPGDREAKTIPLSPPPRRR